MKNKYTIIINKSKHRRHKIVYSYRNIEGIMISIGLDGVTIEFETSANISSDDILLCKNTMIEKIFIKACLIYLCRYSKPLKVEKITIMKNNGKNTFDNVEPPIKFIIDKKLIRPFSSDWRKHSVENFLLTYDKSNKNDKYIEKINKCLYSTIVSLMISKSKIYESERFFYLWISMNGLYNAATHYYNQENKETKPIRKECDKLNVLWKVISGENIPINESPLGNKLKTIYKEKFISQIGAKEFKNIEANTLEQIFDDSLVDNLERILSIDYIQNCEKHDISLKRYMLLDFPYKLRCDMFHASEPIPLISKVNSNLIRTLSVANVILEEFICNEIPKWTNDEYVLNTIIPRLNIGR